MCTFAKLNTLHVHNLDKNDVTVHSLYGSFESLLYHPALFSYGRSTFRFAQVFLGPLCRPSMHYYCCKLPL